MMHAGNPFAFHGIRRVFCAFYAFLIAAGLFCAGGNSRISPARAEELFSDMERRINQGKGYPREKEELLSEKGFFYVLSPEGKLLLHPNPLFVGGDFSGVASVKRILSHDRGNETAEEGGVSRRIVFARLLDGNYLCLSIDSAEYEDTNAGSGVSLPEK